jgi:hypothetical protein
VINKSDSAWKVRSIELDASAFEVNVVKQRREMLG